jgi:hypothetical protein
MSPNKGAVETGQSPLVERQERVEELMLAGIGLSERDSNKPKKFQKAVKRGRKAEKASHTYAGVLARLNAASPVYVRPRAGGWYEVWVREVCVDKVQGEDAALRRMAELTLEYIQVDEAERTSPVDVRAGGGGWYDLIAHGVVIDRVQGEHEAQSRVDELRDTTSIES